MRKLTAGLFMSVDGVVEAPNLWQFDAFDEQLGAELSGVLGRVDTVLLGRVGYQEWSGYWTTAGHDDPFGGFINPVQKYVASTTLTGDLGWQNSSLIEGDLAAFVTELKQGDGGEIAAMGGITIVRELFFAGLLDELTLLTHPVVAGGGRHLFDPSDQTTRLTLIDSYRTAKGNVVSRYAKAE
ncbi:dihydrofolate reductase family protein [Subtercola sp. YIM 133946]|uniref:dihydrofolate reductase family protein n=1 Tax=Subtercola sp. YIM 133946 TaxID=3118909 RepID=UPI002F95BFA4